MAETSRQSSTGCSYFGCSNHPKIQSDLQYFSFPKSKDMIKKWMLRMNLEYVKPLSACVCADHFHEDDMFVSNDGRALLRNYALPNVYDYNMDKSSIDLPSLRMPLLRLSDRPLPSDPDTLTCSFCNTAVASNFLDLRRDDQHQARQIIWLHFGSDALDIELNVRCICQICWTITHNFHIIHNKMMKMSPEANSSNGNDERTNGNAVANLDHSNANQYQHPLRCSDVRQIVIPSNTIEENPNEMAVEYLYDDDEDDEPNAIHESSLGLSSTSIKHGIYEKSDDTDGVINVPKAGIDSSGVPCPHCKRTYFNDLALEKHMSSYHRNIHPCTKCEQSFESVKLLRSHMRWSHFESEACKFCNKLLYNIVGLYHHERICTQANVGDELPELCPECGLGFRNVAILRKHVEKHHFKAIACEQCGEVYDSAIKFKRHKRFHQNPEKFTCDLCGKRFQKARSMKDHRTLHTGEFRYFCDVCQKPFRNNGNYFSHRRKAHPGIDFSTKPMECFCDYCGSRYVAKSGLLNHMKKHMREGFPQPNSRPLADCS